MQEALSQAQAAGLDLVEVAPADVPTCRIFDYSKKIFERKKNAGHKHKNLKLKEVKFSVTIDPHDFNVKLNRFIEFLKTGHKVKASLSFHGRQMAHQELGTEKMNKIKADTAEYGTVESDFKMEGRTCSMVIAPLKQVKKVNVKVGANDAKTENT